MKYFIFITLIVITGRSCGALSDDYDAINKHLVEMLVTEMLEPNFKEAELWLNQISAKSCGRGKCLDHSLIEALKEFVGLYHAVIGDQKCSPATIELLRENSDNVGFGPDWYIDVDKETRVSKLILELARRTSDCDYIFQEELADRLGNFDPNEMDAFNMRLAKVLNTLDVAGSAPGSEHLPNLSGYKAVEEFVLEDVTLHILPLAGAASMLRKKIADFFWLSYVDPCKKYIIQVDEPVGRESRWWCEFIVNHSHDLVERMLERLKQTA